jgi:hypothetical protein
MGFVLILAGLLVLRKTTLMTAAHAPHQHSTALAHHRPRR